MNRDFDKAVHDVIEDYDVRIGQLRKVISEPSTSRTLLAAAELEREHIRLLKLRAELLRTYDLQRAEERRGGWIPVGERRPEAGAPVLYLHKFDDQPRIGPHRKLDQQWYWGHDWEDYDHEVTHWQPLPGVPT